MRHSLPRLECMFNFVAGSGRTITRVESQRASCVRFAADVSGPEDALRLLMVAIASLYAFLQANLTGCAMWCHELCSSSFDVLFCHLRVLQYVLTADILLSRVDFILLADLGRPRKTSNTTSAVPSVSLDETGDFIEVTLTSEMCVACRPREPGLPVSPAQLDRPRAISPEPPLQTASNRDATPAGDAPSGVGHMILDRISPALSRMWWA